LIHSCLLTSFSFYFFFFFFFPFLSPRNRVLLTCTELCSLHMQLDSRIDNLVGSALFSDGSGSMIIGMNPREGERPIFEMHQNASVIIPDTIDMMAW
jgi:alpha-pyrone synthase